MVRTPMDWLTEVEEDALKIGPGTSNHIHDPGGQRGYREGNVMLTRSFPLRREGERSVGGEVRNKGPLDCLDIKKREGAIDGEVMSHQVPLSKVDVKQRKDKPLITWQASLTEVFVSQRCLELMYKGTERLRADRSKCFSMQSGERAHGGGQSTAPEFLLLRSQPKKGSVGKMKFLHRYLKCKSSDRNRETGEQKK